MGLFCFWPFKRRRRQKPAEGESGACVAAEQPAQPPPDLWQLLGTSVRGAAHERTDLPNQDAIGWRPESGRGRSVLLALADGHGSAKSFRSEVGSRLAVETALEVLQEFLNGQPDPTDMSACKRTLEEQLPMVIERRWKAAVTKHLDERPLLVKEVMRLEESDGATARRSVEQEPVHAYGSTLIAILLHESFLACLQLGDGDILFVTDAGDVIRPIEDDPRLMANETTSLGSTDCWRDFRVCFQAFADAPPALVLASTDGYSNSFSSPQGFLAVGGDLLETLRTEGPASLAENLPQWLEEASRQGSGDDVTAGIICRLAMAEGLGRAATSAHDG